MSVRVNAVEVDGGNIPRPLTIIHGRSEIGVQPDPPSVEFEWWDPVMPWTLGDVVEVFDDVPYTPATYDDPVVTYDSLTSTYDSTATGTLNAKHFGGKIVEIEATGYGGEVQAWRIAAVGHLARWGTVPVKLTGLPAQTDVARVQAIADAAGLLPALRIDGAAGVTLAAGDVDDDALSAIHDVCESSGGLFWQARDGLIHYTTAAYRQANQAPDFSVTAGLIVDELQWQQAVEEIVNEVKIQYGPAATRAETVIKDDQSIAAAWGLRSVSVDTTINALADAQALGALIVARRAWPFWGSINALVTVDPPDEVLFATADVNTVVLLPIPVAPGATPLANPAPWVIEGWEETWTESMEHEATLAASDQRRWVTTTLRTYTEVNAGGTYAYWLGNFGSNAYLDLLVKGAT